MTVDPTPLRILDAEIAATRARLRHMEDARRGLENSLSDALGYRVPLRGPALMAAVERGSARG